MGSGDHDPGAAEGGIPLSRSGVAAALPTARWPSLDAGPLRAPASDMAGRVFGGRYELVRLLGEGAFGRVYRAFDVQSSNTVAVKLLATGTDERDLERVRNEAAMLRSLYLPGVVPWLEDGVDDEVAWVVMDLVEGAPFPGSPARGWDGVSSKVQALLEVVARVHRVGVLHRDLKPDNALVRADGRVELLDFGVAAKGAGAVIDGEGVLVGTPAYLAPEQIVGGQTDRRSDIYALGVMIFEACCGVLPHEDADPRELLRLRMAERAPCLSTLAPGTPDDVVAVVGEMLERWPDHRPETVEEVLRRIRPHVVDDWQLPRLGAGNVVASVSKRLLARASVVVAGGVGMGRGRLVDDVAANLREAGVDVLLVTPSSRPFGSFEGRHIRVMAADHHDLTDEVIAAMRRRMSGRAVLLVDDVEALDDGSRAVVEGLHDVPQLRVQVDATNADVVLEPFTSELLRELFHGPDTLLHLRRDGARELYRRTHGTPQEVVSELGTWIRAGLATWRDQHVQISRAALDRLADDLQVNPIPAFSLMSGSEDGGAPPDPDAMPLGAPGRFARLVAQGRLEDAVDEGIVRVDHLVAAERIEASRPTAAEAWRLAVRLRDPNRQRAVLARQARFALALMREDDLTELAARAETVGWPELASLLVMANRVRTQRDPDMLARIEALRPTGEPELDTYLFSIAAFCRHGSDPAGKRAWLEARRPPLGASVQRRASWAAARGTHAWMLEDYEGAAQWSLRATTLLRDHGLPWLTSSFNACLGLLDAGMVGEALELGEQSLTLAVSRRLVDAQARFTYVVKAARYRMGEDMAADFELAEIAYRLRVPLVPWMLDLLNVTFSWRRGELCTKHVEALNGRVGNSVPADVAVLWRAMAFHATGRGDPDALLDQASAVTYPGLALQVAALVCHATQPPAPARRVVFEACGARIGELRKSHRLEVLSWEECVAALWPEHEQAAAGRETWPRYAWAAHRT